MVKKYDKEKEHKRYLRKKAKNPERYKALNYECVKRYRKKNRDKVRAQGREYAKRKPKKTLTEKEKAKKVEWVQKWQRKNREKTRAQGKLRYAVKIGKIKKPENCEVCNKVTKLEGHHRDYKKPLEVIWVCRACHAYTHRLKDKELRERKIFSFKSSAKG